MKRTRKRLATSTVHKASAETDQLHSTSSIVDKASTETDEVPGSRPCEVVKQAMKRTRKRLATSTVHKASAETHQLHSTSSIVDKASTETDEVPGSRPCEVVKQAMKRTRKRLATSTVHKASAETHQLPFHIKYC